MTTRRPRLSNLRPPIRRRRRRDGEHGQILVMFTLVVVLLMALAAVVIDVGLLRTDTGKLQNALDAGALAAAQSLPVSKTNITAVSTVARDFSRTNYPGMPNGNIPDPTVKYACLIGVDGAGLPRVADMPAVCNVSLAASSPLWLCTTVVCWAPCDPVAVLTDVCNTIILNDNVTRPYTFGRAVNVNSGNSGVISSAACTGLCGNLPVAPVDVVLLLDRTGSMDDSNSVDNLRSGAFSVLQAFDPTLQRIALGLHRAHVADAHERRLLRPEVVVRGDQRVHAGGCLHPHGARDRPRPDVPGDGQPAQLHHLVPERQRRQRTRRRDGHRPSGRHQRRRLPAGVDHGRRRQQRQHPDPGRLDADRPNRQRVQRRRRDVLPLRDRPRTRRPATGRGSPRTTPARPASSSATRASIPPIRSTPRTRTPTPGSAPAPPSPPRPSAPRTATRRWSACSRPTPETRRTPPTTSR